MKKKSKKTKLGQGLLKGMKEAANHQIVEEYIGDLEHFFIPNYGGWPIKAEAKHTRLCKLVPCLKIESGYIKKVEGKEPDSALMAQLWEYKYKELDERYSKLYNGISKLYQEF